jgi:molybdopterin-biosynthesis enzyme MoeA-like protein
MNIGLLIIGDEILSGKREDKHLPKVIALLAARGLALAWARYVGDDRDRITATLRDAYAGGDLVFSCGGIGATPDDHTRQAAAAARDVPLE